MPVFEDAPFSLRRQSEPGCGLARFGLRGFEDSFNADGPLPPFWSVAPMLDVEPARAGGPGLAGLRLAGRVLVLKLERDGSAQQVLMGDGEAFDQVRYTLSRAASAGSAGATD